MRSVLVQDIDVYESCTSPCLMHVPVINVLLLTLDSQADGKGLNRYVTVFGKQMDILGNHVHNFWTFRDVSTL